MRINHDACKILDELELPRVIEVYRGKFPGKEKIKELAEGKSTLGSHIKEGIVIKTVTEKVKHFGRLQLKLVGEGYSLQK